MDQLKNNFNQIKFLEKEQAEQIRSIYKCNSNNNM